MSKQAVRSWLLGMVVLGLAVRLFEIGEPLIDKQAWRQADTAAVARNYFEEGYELLWPRVDWRGATAGYRDELSTLPVSRVRFIWSLG